jgi:hypothetical protein
MLLLLAVSTGFAKVEIDPNSAAERTADRYPDFLFIRAKPEFSRCM